ncbi:FAD-dependent oxidoreductase [Salinibacterium hongtaonis]|uniref:Pyridine nucleotide-disulfide oxidoreductase n=1 Tax=Homoserinimonas hongtaonis TaxID=2079791 RepID=A0A2U1T175_9MICO|nr:FAD-dependent oxidoreductase [Salinibacterium hongtaonis]PWB97617.1 pyridine nucleotide-disulfide oxidoreductase [Salinibacterium hongtaonis]
MTTTQTRASVVVIGAGQAGLSVAYYLKRLGLEPGDGLVVLDRGPGAGGAWQHRWEALRIGVAHRINDLPGLDDLGLSFETADRQRPAREVVAEYYEAYEKHFELDVVRPASVTQVFNRGIDLVVEYADVDGLHEIVTDVVVNATGTWGSPFVPWYGGLDAFEGEQITTTTYRDASDFEGKSVVVVGGGTSAIGFVMELENVAATITWVSRRPIELRDDGELNLEDSKRAVSAQDEAAREGRALPSVVSGTGVPRTRRIQSAIERGLLERKPMFDRVDATGVIWPDGSRADADVIVWATGFRPELRHLAPLRLREKEGGVTVGNASSWKDPRIFFAGYGPQASTIGAQRSGRTIARQVMAQLNNL